MANQEKPAAIGVRAPRDLLDWLKREAAANRRSMSAQVVYLLEQKRREAVAHA